VRPGRLGLIALAAALVFALLAAPGSARAASTPPDCPADVGAPAAIAIEVSTGDVVCARHADERLPIGSTTKLMTALLTFEHVKHLGSTVFTASDYRPAPIESQIGLEPGERMTVADLLRGLLVESGNDAAAALAQGIGGSQSAFVKMMNKRAAQLGLKNTHYENPIGLDAPGNYSSARDLVTLATVLRTNAFFKKVTNSPTITLKSGDHPRTFTNSNALLSQYSWVNGVKTGHTTDAGYVLVGGASRNGIQLITAVLSTPSIAARDEDTIDLMKWAFPHFQRIRAVVDGAKLASVPVRMQPGRKVALDATKTVRRVVRRGHRGEVKITIDAPHRVSGPVRRGTRLGTATVRQGGLVVASVPLVAAVAVPPPPPPPKPHSKTTLPLLLIGLLLVIGGTFLLARRRLHRAARRPSREARAA
jgi:serine-type D-Ala-D-Ala carboxypeptidase (penicillin-binding protein 5/6)